MLIETGAIAVHIGAQASAQSLALPMSEQSPFIGIGCDIICGDTHASAAPDEPSTKDIAITAIRTLVRKRPRNMGPLIRHKALENHQALVVGRWPGCICRSRWTGVVGADGLEPPTLSV